MRPTILAAATLLLSLASAASASTVDTFSFTQGGFTEPGPLSPGVLSGTFSGNVEASGYIELADLTSIDVQFTQPGLGTLSGNKPIYFFSYLPGGGSSSLDFATSIDGAGIACTGAVAAFGAYGCGKGGSNGYVFGATTNNLAQVTLISSVTTPPPPVSSVPEPASLALFGSGILPLAWLTRRLREHVAR